MGDFRGLVTKDDNFVGRPEVRDLQTGDIFCLSTWEWDSKPNNGDGAYDRIGTKLKQISIDEALEKCKDKMDATRDVEARNLLHTSIGRLEAEVTQSRPLVKELPVKKELSPHEKVIKYCVKLEKYIKELDNSLNPPTMERKEQLHSQINLLQGELGWP